MLKHYATLSEAEVLALAISNEEEDARIYRTFASRLRELYPASAKMFEAMADEEDEHHRVLLDLYQRKFGSEIPLITRADVRGFLRRRPVWLADGLRLNAARQQAMVMETEAARFYADAAARTKDADVRRLLQDLSETENKHSNLALQLSEQAQAGDAGSQEIAAQRRLLVLQVVQPGLAGLIDGSISTLAPIFAAAFATHNSWNAFLVGLAASLGAGISMGLTEAISDDGAITGRGQPWIRGAACGVMTTVGGLGHTLPYLIPDFWTATTIAAIIVMFELAAIAYVRWRFMETPFTSALVQVVLGGILVLLTGIFIGSS